MVCRDLEHLAFVLNRQSRVQDRPRGPADRWLQTISGPGLTLLFFTTTFAMIDCLSLEPDWYSTIYGVLIVGMA